MSASSEKPASRSRTQAKQHARKAAGYSVHVFTASGGAVAVLALYAAIERDFTMMFAWLGLALFIDGVDGTLARAARVEETAAAINGSVLDLVVDFLTYVLVPVVAIWRSDLMPEKWAFWIGLVVTMASALYFADSRMKTSDNWFRGFPAIWNVFVLYLFVFDLPPFWTAFAILAATAAMFAPIVFVHPMRVARLRTVTVAVTIVWFALATLAVASDLAVGWAVKSGLLACAGYILLLPLTRHSPWAEGQGSDPVT